MTIVISPVTAINPVASAVAENATREERQQDLRLHQIVRATVAEGGQDRITLELGPRRFQTETNLPLKSGQNLDLLVVETSPRLVLEVVKDPLGTRLGQALHLLGARGEGIGLLAQLKSASGGELFGQLSPASRQVLELWLSLLENDGQVPGGERLQLLARQLGLDLEARLAAGEGGEAAATLKTALLEATRLLEDHDAPLAEGLRQLVQGLELFQLSQVRLEQQGMFLVPLLLPFLERGYLLARKQAPPTPEEPEPPQVISLHLALQALGDLRIDLLQDAQGLHLRFVCDDPAKTEFVAGFGQELEAALEPFGLGGLSFAAGAESPAKALIKKLLPDGNGVLDTRV
ncbi:hypothetical protein DESUT3_36590 [Desulfuromonas versatilis]|uniref:Flagellar hook-length control protein-like C-terminal domain-containing protein n=1 Tax=Desulfuromonas versatilis TaxID=2802975 RepID=A0ABN6E2L4_9BACT|nr:hypothetical protein [Desulfuromonas versatilis]BCR06590.1 hypothetical protein DESUT3_36590 [Desulfuromonas versatilis]